MIYSKPLLRTLDNFHLQCAAGSAATVDLTCGVGPDVNTGSVCDSGGGPSNTFVPINCNSNGSAAGPGVANCNAVGIGPGTGCGTGNVVT